MVDVATTEAVEKPGRRKAAEPSFVIVNYKRDDMSPSPLTVPRLTKPLLEGGNIISAAEWEDFAEGQIGKRGLSMGTFRPLGNQSEFLESTPVYELLDLAKAATNGEFLAWLLENGGKEVTIAARKRFEELGLDYEKLKVAS